MLEYIAWVPPLPKDYDELLEYNAQDCPYEDTRMIHECIENKI